MFPAEPLYREVSSGHCLPSDKRPFLEVFKTVLLFQVVQDSISSCTLRIKTDIVNKLLSNIVYLVSYFILYYFIFHNLLFLSASYWITLDQIELNLKSLFQLVVVAEDFGEPALRQTANVLIIIDDVNDVIPKFEQDELRYGPNRIFLSFE